MLEGQNCIEKGEVCIAIEVAGLGGNCIAIQFSGQQVCIAIQTVL